jgi:hypothetical protein
MLEAFHPLYTPGAKRLYSFEARNEAALLSAEVRRTLDAFAAAAQARIARGQLTEGEAKAQAGLWLAIAEDLEAWTAGAPPWLREPERSIAAELRTLQAKNGVRWTHKVATLRREVLARRDGYEREIGKGLLTPDQAKRQLERLEAVHDLYWRHAFAFDGSIDELRALGEMVTDQAIARYGPAEVPSTISSDEAAAQLEQLDRDADNREQEAA